MITDGKINRVCSNVKCPVCGEDTFIIRNGRKEKTEICSGCGWFVDYKLFHECLSIRDLVLD